MTRSISESWIVARLSVITTESVGELDLRIGDEVQLIVKAIHVLPMKA